LQERGSPRIEVRKLEVRLGQTPKGGGLARSVHQGSTPGAMVMFDILYVAATVVFFAAAYAYAWGCTKV